MFETSTAPTIASSSAFPYSFCTSSTSVPGNQTSAPPIIGMIEQTAVTTPQNSGPGSPTIANAPPTSAPCITAVAIMPRNVACVTFTNRSRSRSIFGSENGRTFRTCSHVLPSERSTK